MYTFMYNETENMVRIKNGALSIAIHNIGPKVAEFLQTLVEVANSVQPTAHPAPQENGYSCSHGYFEGCCIEKDCPNNSEHPKDGEDD